jgi:hypothetical protein
MSDEDVAVLAIPLRQQWILVTMDRAHGIVRDEDDDAIDALVYAVCKERNGRQPVG